MNQALINYIQKAKVAGKSEEEIKNTALGMGWKENDVMEAFKAAAGEGLPAQAGIAVPPPTPEAAMAQAVPSKAFSAKLILIIIGAVALLIIGGGAAYYFLIMKPAQKAEQAPPIEQPQVPTPPPAPTPEEQPIAPQEEVPPPAVQPTEEILPGGTEPEPTEQQPEAQPQPELPSPAEAPAPPSPPPPPPPTP